MFQVTSSEQSHAGGRFCEQNDAATRRRLEIDERQPSCFAFEEESGGQWSGHGAMIPSIIESKLTL